MMTSAWMFCLAAPLGAQGGTPPNAAAPSRTLANGAMRVTLPQGREAPGWFVDSIEMRVGDAWRTILRGLDGREFNTSLGGCNAAECRVDQDARGVATAHLAGKIEAWEARESIALDPTAPILRRRQTYRFLKPCEASSTSSNPPTSAGPSA
jgi:hypothetical protein